MTVRKLRSPRDRVTFALGFATACLLYLTAGVAGQEGIPWRPDYSQAEQEARERGRPLWVQFTGPWCHFCTLMERETFSHPRIIRDARDSFIPVKLQSDVHEQIALRYGLAGLPATILVAPSGEVIAKHEGFLDVDTFHAFLDSALTRIGRPTTAPGRAVVGAPRKADALALAGYCPVSLVDDRKLVAGQSAVALTHGGRVYRFANAKVRDVFRKQPERFIPVNGGRCPVTQVDRGESRPGDPRWGALYEGHLYLCADAAARSHFLKNPVRYAHVDVADRGFCPHCWTRETLLVRGSPKYSLTRDGRRYFFPDPSHLEAFRTSSETTRR